MRSSSRPAGARGLNFKIVLFALLLLVVSGGVFTVVTSQMPEYHVAVARVTVYPGTKLTPESIEWVSLSGEKKIAGLVNEQMVEDCKLYSRLTTNTVYAGAAIQLSDFFIPEGGCGPDSKSYQGRISELLGVSTDDGQPDPRALVLLGDATSTFVQPGDWVDIYFVSEESAKRMMSKQVLFTVQRPLPVAEGENPDYVPTGTYFILRDMSAQEAQDLIFAQQVGELRITIGRPDSVELPETIQTDADYFSRTYGVTIPGYLPPEPTASPSTGPTFDPFAPSPSPSAEPSVEPTPEPTAEPTPEPSTSAEPSPSSSVPGLPDPTDQP